MAGSISLSLSQRFDSLGRPLAGGLLYTYAAGTTTPQSAYQDTGLVTALPNPITLDAFGNIPQLFFADGNIKVLLKDANGITQLAADNILVIGPSAGGGGGATVDPTTVLQTGWIQPIYGTGNVTGFVRLNGRTIGNASSGATERANADTSALFTFLYNTDANLTVAPGGRGSSAAADYAANKTIALPDFRSRALAGLGDMGNSDNALFSGVTFASGNSTTLGSLLGAARRTLLAGSIPPHAHSGTTGGDLVGHTHTYDKPSFGASTYQTGTGAPAPVVTAGQATGGESTGHTHNFTTDNGPGTSTAFDAVSPYALVTIYCKL